MLGTMPAPPRTRTGLAALFALASARCTLLISSDGLVGSETPLDTDGGNGTDGARADAPSGDAGSNDAPSNQDATDAPAQRWCAQQTPAPRFCDDFDDQGPFALWPDQLLEPGTAITRDGQNARSAPSSALVTVPGGAVQHARLKRVLGVATKLTYSFDLAVDKWGGYAEIAYVTVAGTSVHHAYYVRVSDANSALGVTAEAYPPDGGVPQHNLTLTTPPAPGQWKRISLEIDLGSSPRKMTARVDGAVVGSSDLEAELYQPGEATVSVGIGFSPSSASAWAIRFDNATAVWQ